MMVMMLPQNLTQLFQRRFHISFDVKRVQLQTMVIR